jgi:hypothetical protein
MGSRRVKDSAVRAQFTMHGAGEQVPNPREFTGKLYLNTICIRVQGTFIGNSKKVLDHKRQEQLSDDIKVVIQRALADSNVSENRTLGFRRCSGPCVEEKTVATRLNNL